LAQIKVAARDWTVEIQTGVDGTTGEPIYTPINELTTLTFGSEKEDRDTTTFNSGGWAEHLVAQRGRTLGIEGYHSEDPATGARDAGQQAVDDHGDKVGADSLAGFRLTSPGGNIKTFMASSNPSEKGGGNNDNTSWGAELTISGKVTAA
jgi:hypothetical protein